ncbi:MAG: bifunctional adenosylcobinamide kinase/adenosylcobinamide-phosphate guanylyltransferase [Anaerocolumna sp.]
MELYIGGISQGKLNYVCSKKTISKDSEEICDGISCTLEEILSKKIINHLHLFIKRLLMEWTGNSQELSIIDLTGHPDLKPGYTAEPQKMMEVFIKELIHKNPSAVIICNEVGYGIVPMDKADRIFRETVGRSLCKLAEYSFSVERIVCGLGMKIK